MGEQPPLRAVSCSAHIQHPPHTHPPTPTRAPRDRPARPFKCLDAQYRRELVRVYLTNVEGICRRFVDEKREALQARAPPPPPSLVCVGVYVWTRRARRCRQAPPPPHPPHTHLPAQRLVDPGCGFKLYWRALHPEQQQQLGSEPTGTIFKASAYARVRACVGRGVLGGGRRA